jgi:hypothetical protein
MTAAMQGLFAGGARVFTGVVRVWVSDRRVFFRAAVRSGAPNRSGEAAWSHRR